MRTSNYAFLTLWASVLLFACGVLSAASGQTISGSSTNSAPPQQQQKPARPTVVLPEEQSARPVAGDTELYCAGFIQSEPVVIDLEIVGGEKEESSRVFSTGDYLFINAGAQQGMRVGQSFSIVRPRTPFDSKFTQKKGGLGVFVQELGQLRVTEVKDRVSIAQVTNACEMIFLGDLLRSVPRRVAPLTRPEVALPHFSDPNGKQQGRIVLARDGQEMLSRNQIVYIDLGSEDRIKSGDYLTVFRPMGTGNLLINVENEEIARNSSRGFESDLRQGGKYSIQAKRPKDSNDPGFFNRPLTTKEIKGRRPPLPRKVVGEIVVLNVQGRTATAIITQVAQEIHTGDYVELQ
ncbi:MAG TPA: hypothetical protein VIW80_06010 [Pyrinomonadaceae bacterium]